MDIESTITVHCGNLSARDMILVWSLASAVGADVRPFAGQDPEYVRVELYVVIGGRETVVGNYDTPRRELTGMNHTMLAGHIRETLIEQMGVFICKEVRESITPPPPYNDTGCYFRRQKVFLESTGDRHKDRLLASKYNHYVERETRIK